MEISTKDLAEAIDELLLEAKIYDVDTYGWLNEDDHDPEFVGYAMWTTSPPYDFSIELDFNDMNAVPSRIATANQKRLVELGTDFMELMKAAFAGGLPTCGRVSTSRHSVYVRTLKDLPALGATVSLRIRVSRWRCGAPACAVRFFAARLRGVAEFRGRRTCRANVVARLIGYALGGRPGERLARRIGLPVSNDTLLRWVKRCAQPVSPEARVIGIDEWAKRKGHTYGTIVVDLERHTVIDVLDQHSTEAVEQWLVAHPDIQMICRDRNGRYAKAARRAAPATRQVTDRFHLVQNLRETIERELALHRAYLRVRVTPNGLPADPLPVPVIDPPVCPPVARERQLLPARRLAIQTEIGRQLRQSDQHLFDTFKAL